MDLPHESFARAVAKEPDSFSVRKFDPSMYPPRYREHAVVKAKGDLAVPVGYFSDGVPHTKKDSFIAHYWSNTLTGQRYMICSIRKSDLCRCGCKGFCTIGRLQRIIAWSFNVLADGRYPRFDYNGQPFADELRSSTKITCRFTQHLPAACSHCIPRIWKICSKSNLHFCTFNHKMFEISPPTSVCCFGDRTDTL